MPLVPATLQAQILDAFSSQTAKTDNTQVALADLAQKLAAAIDTYIKSATITVPPGVAVATTGTAAAQTGVTTGPGVATIT
jgi:hypothetical protein